MDKKYGIVGFPLGHSFSQKYFEDKFKEEKIDNAKFLKFEIEHIADIKNVLNTDGLEGFCITIPHKKNIISYLDNLSPEVQQMQACNCVRIKDGKLTGHNTDVIGFEKSFVPHLLPFHTKALVLGTGGASAAVTYVLRKLAIPFQVVSRHGAHLLHYEDINADILDEYKIIINTTPLGTFPKVDTAPALPYEHLTPQHYLYDLVYNPELTLFLAKGKAHGATIQNGYPMLVIQAEKNWEIWNS